MSCSSTCRTRLLNSLWAWRGSFQSNTWNATGKQAVRVGQRRTYAASPQQPPTSVEKIILDTIKANGPVSFATYMQMCLAHPTEGYYMKSSNPVFGARGDFTTSPEISQVFGELVAIWLLSQWQLTGKSRPIRVVELGPGRGTLMEDLLRVFAQFSAPKAALREIHLVETSSAMQALQNVKLSPVSQKNGWNIKWHDSINDIPRDPSTFTMVVAHEFFDALPFHLLEKTHQGWQEVMIASAEPPAQPTLDVSQGQQPNSVLHLTPVNSSISPHPRFRQVLSRSPTASSTLLGLSSQRFQKLAVGARIEVSPAAFKIAHQIGELVESAADNQESAGSALIVDYGGDKAYGSSFRAFKDHKVVDVFHRPGECDLTVNVDFAYLKEAMADLAVVPYGPLPQATFLKRMGLDMRMDALKKAASSEERRREIGSAAQRLVDLTGMGSQYQVMGFSGKLPHEASAQEKWPFVES